MRGADIAAAHAPAAPAAEAAHGAPLAVRAVAGAVTSHAEEGVVSAKAFDAFSVLGHVYAWITPICVYHDASTIYRYLGSVKPATMPRVPRALIALTALAAALRLPDPRLAVAVAGRGADRRARAREPRRALPPGRRAGGEPAAVLRRRVAVDPRRGDERVRAAAAVGRCAGSRSCRSPTGSGGGWRRSAPASRWRRSSPCTRCSSTTRRRRAGTRRSRSRARSGSSTSSTRSRAGAARSGGRWRRRWRSAATTSRSSRSPSRRRSCSRAAAARRCPRWRASAWSAWACSRSCSSRSAAGTATT